jgi:putative endonuclease
MAYWVYVLRSLKNDSYYIGYASDLERRLKQHNDGLVKATKYKRPFEIIYTEQFDSGTEARKREFLLKSKKSRKYIDWLIAQKTGV